MAKKTDEIDYQIFGSDMQVVEIELDPEETCIAEVGTMLYMDDDIEMSTGAGGLFSGLKRMFSGEGFFITTFTNEGDAKAHVGFAAPYPGKIIPIDLQQFEGRFYVQKDGFLCAAKGIEVEVAFTRRIGAGLFGGEGFIMQKLEGDGLAFVHAGGTAVRRDLDDGEVIHVDTGSVIGYSKDIDFDIKFIGGISNALFGGEGLFLTKLKGPGTVYLQSLPFSRIADRIVAASKTLQEQLKEKNKKDK